MTAILLPRVTEGIDPLFTLADFHDAIRDVAALLPAIVDDEGHASPRDARWLRAFLQGPLAWHIIDEQARLGPLLEGRKSRWLDGCLSRVRDNHARIAAAAAELGALLTPLAAGDPVPRARWLTAARAFSAATESALRFEDDVLIPTAHLFLDVDERAAFAADILAQDEHRPWQQVAVAADASVVHRIHRVRTHTPAGDRLRSFADCPRRRSASIAECAGCEHLESIHVNPSTGRGEIACAIDDTVRRAGGAPTIMDIMTRDVLCIDAGTTLLDAARVLADAGVSGLPVVDDAGHAVGILSQSDLVGALAADLDMRMSTVHDVMMHAAFTVHETDTVDAAARLLVAEGIHRLPVVNADHVVVGIVSTLDVVRATVAPRP